MLELWVDTWIHVTITRLVQIGGRVLSSDLINSPPVSVSHSLVRMLQAYAAAA